MSMEKLIIGCWQLAGGHGTVDRDKALQCLFDLFVSGVKTFDCADIYSGVEEMLGALRLRIVERLGDQAAETLRLHTKCVPDLDVLSPNCGGEVERTVLRSCKRLGVRQLDLVQFHWWDYKKPGMNAALAALQRLQGEGVIKKIGLTNFSGAKLQEILSAGIPLHSIQVQFSILDSRPEQDLVPLCLKHDIKIFCYGTLAGGFLSERYLGAEEPKASLPNRSLTKYKLIIDEIGGWTKYQIILKALAAVASRRQCSLAEVAAAYQLSRTGVTANIIGLGKGTSMKSLKTIVSLELADDDICDIEAARSLCSKVSGAVYEAERERDGPHGKIMRYNLNR